MERIAVSGGFADAIFDCDKEHKEVFRIEFAPIARAEFIRRNRRDVFFGRAVFFYVLDIVACVFDVPDERRHSPISTAALPLSRDHAKMPR